MKSVYFILLSLFLSLRIFATTPKEILSKVLTATKNVQNYECFSRMIEKTDSKISTNISYSKISYTPFRVYMTNVAPEAGMQLLYNPKITEGKIYVKTPPITFLTLKLEPDSSIVRGNFHHPIEYSGTRFAKRILDYITQHLEDYNFTLSTNAFQNRPVFEILLLTRNFRYLPSTVQKTESLQSLCSRLLVNEYVVLTRNKNIHSYQQILQKGTTLLLPSHFFKKLLVFIDQENFLPVVEKIWDDKGFLEQYDMYRIKIKPTFETKDFLPATYGFQ